jgi:threonine dehydrogenase-like Zn-dependent dehydrogenase
MAKETMTVPSMTAVTWDGPDTLTQVSKCVPELSDGWSLVRLGKVGIRGSDLTILHGHHARAQPGTVTGHEFAGTVVQVSGESPLNVRSRVAVFPLISCADRGVPLWKP